MVPENVGHANIDVTHVVCCKNWREERSKELTDTYHGFPRSPLR